MTTIASAKKAFRLPGWRLLRVLLKRRAGAAAMTGLALAQAPGVIHASPSSVQEENLGAPIHSITIPAAAIGPDLQGGHLLYVVANGNPAVFTAVAIPSGKRVHSEPLPGVHASWSMDVAADGSVFIGTNRNGHLYRWRPGDDSAESVAGERLAGETHLYGTVAGDDGWIYNGSYPNGKVFRFNPQTGESHDYGPAVEGVNYVRNLAYSDGTIYAATYPESHLVAIDTEDGGKEELPLPPGREENISHLTVVEDRLFARAGNRLCVYDLTAGEWIGEGPRMAGFSRTAYFEVQRVLYLADEEFRVHRYDFESGRFEDIDLKVPAGPRSFEVLRLDQDRFPGYSLVGSGMRGDLWTYHLDAGELERVEPDIDGVPIVIRSMTSGPDGNVYIGGYLAPMEFARFDPDAGEIEKLPWGAQVEAMLVHRERIYMGRYPRASVVVYDPARPVSRENPETLFSLADHGQDRPFAFTAAGDLLAVGTVPKAGKLGGVLAFYDTATGNLDVHREVVPNQSIVSLVSRDGILVGGTTVWGGLGIEPAEEEARLFLWDLEAGVKTWAGAPLSGEKAISDLTFTPDGALWGITAATLFRFDPEAREVVEQHELFSYDWDRTFWQSSFLEFDESEGVFYGTAAGRLFRFDPASGRADLLAGDAGYFARDRYGELYYSRGTDLIRARLKD